MDRIETLLSLIHVETNMSLRAVEDIIRVVKSLDPHSTILQKIQLGRTKLSTNGLKSFKNKQLQKKMQDAVVIVLSTDSITCRLKHELMESLCKDVDVLANFLMKPLKELRPNS